MKLERKRRVQAHQRRRRHYRQQVREAQAVAQLTMVVYPDILAKRQALLRALGLA